MRQRQADEWSEAWVGRLFNGGHRPVTLTVPSELRVYFEQHPESRSLLNEAANATLGPVMRGEAGRVMVRHPEGKALKVNYHLHVQVREGGLDEERVWPERSYLSQKGVCQRQAIWSKPYLPVISRASMCMPNRK